MIRWLRKVLGMESKPPRKQCLHCATKELPDEIFAVIRLSWFKDGKPYEVDEIQLIDNGDDDFEGFSSVVGEALKAGADVSILTAYDAEDLGIKA